jgi:hypothetical protein
MTASMTPTPTPTPQPTRRVQVFELLNIRRRESLLAITEGGEDDLLERLRLAPPPEAATWAPRADDLSVQLLTPLLPREAAEEFVVRYMATMRPRTWRYAVWRAR